MDCRKGIVAHYLWAENLVGYVQLALIEQFVEVATGNDFVKFC